MRPYFLAGGWESLPQGFDVKPLPVGVTVINGVQIKALAVNDEGQDALVRAIELGAVDHKADTIYLSEPRYREMPEVLGNHPLPPRKQWWCYVAFIQGVPVEKPPRAPYQLDAPAIGFRAFKWDGGPLKSVGVQATWPVQREPQCASCIYQQENNPYALAGELYHFGNHEDDAPSEGCTCGIYAHSSPDVIQFSTIKAVVIGYGKLIIHPDGWRAERCEIIGLIAPEPKPELDEGKLQAEAERLAEKYTYTEGYVRIHVGTWPEPPPPSREALEIIAEQYGTRVIENWDDGIALAQEQGAVPIPDELHVKASESATTQQMGGYTVPSMWTTGEPQWSVQWINQTPVAIPASQLNCEQVAVTKAGKQPRASFITKLKREKRELHAKHWKPGSKAA